jgi:hypothetical protein
LEINVGWRFFSKPNGPACPVGRLDLDSNGVAGEGNNLTLQAFFIFLRFWIIVLGYI